MALDGWKEKLFQRYLYYRCRPARVKKRLRKLIDQPRKTPPIDRRRIKAAALQLEVKLFKDPLGYVDEMNRCAAAAAAAGAHLAVFPENNNLQLLGILPGADKLGEDDEGADGASPQDPDISLENIIHYIGPVLKPLIHTTFSTLAAAYGLYIMAGSFLLSENGRVYNRAHLYGSDGALIGLQDKVHPLPMEEDFGVVRGECFKVFKTGLGKLALPVCMDASYFETFRLLEMMGAEIVMVPIANAEQYNYWLALRGIWPRVQESPLYGIKSALVGRGLGLTFTGKSGVFAPLELTPDGSGVLAEVESPEKEGMAVAELDMEALSALRANHPWRDHNRELYNRYFPSLYKNAPALK